MKSAIIFSFILAGSSMMLKTNTIKKVSYTYKTTESKRSFSSAPILPVSIVVSKSKYELSVYDAKGWYATYPVVFGNSSLADKKMEGDRNTPEGTFKIISKRLHEKWDRYMGLDYPTRETLAKFNEWKKKGEIPKYASPGGGIGIHGTFPHEDFVIDRYTNWTDGCISLKREDIEDLYSYCPVGTPISIKK